MITTFDETTGTVPIHNVSIKDVERQCQALNLEWIPVPLPKQCPNAIYIERLSPVFKRFDSIVFGDLFLRDIRNFRERSFPETALEFPLWGRNTLELAREMIDGGLVADVTAAKEPAWIGRRFDHALLRDLPAGTDPCGENGEFHTLVDPQCLASFR